MTDRTQIDSPTRSCEKSAEPVALKLSMDPGSVTKLVELFRQTLETTLANAQMRDQAQERPAQIPVVQAREPSASPSPGTRLTPADKLKAADVRMAVLTGKIPEDAGLMIDTKLLAKLLNISQRHVNRLQDLKKLPAPVYLGHLKRWRLAEILEWIEADCPPESVWVHKRQESGRRRGR